MALNLFSSDRFVFLNPDLLQARLCWSVRFRWIAIAGFFFATLIAKFVYVLQIPYQQVWLCLSVLAVINLIYLIILKIYKRFSFHSELVFMQIHIFVDLVMLTLVLHLTGGIENPIYLFYVFHVVISSILFPGTIPVFYATFVIVLFSSLIFLEYQGIIPHYTLFSDKLHNNSVFLLLTLVVFTVTVYMTAYICTTFMYVYRKLKRELDIKNNQLVEADKQKSQIFRFTSHELKSPLIAVKTTLDSVLKNFGDQIDGKALNLLQRGSNRAAQMLDILKELLELSRHRDLKDRKEKQLINIHDIINQAIQAESAQIEAKGVRVRTKYSKHKPMVHSGLNDVEKIFSNLISNAVRYNKDNGEIVINTAVHDDTVEIVIKDSGIGIAAEDLDKIFTEFYRAENAKKTVNFGTGLGLSLVKQLIESNGGTISVQSDLNRGTSFRIELKLAANHDLAEGD